MQGVVMQGAVTSRAAVPAAALPGMRRALSAVLVAGAALVAQALPAWAEDLILKRNPDTCEIETIRAFEVLPETWTEVRYKESARGQEKSVPLPLVVDIQRGGTSKEKSLLEAALQELERGNVTEARIALRDLAAGGYKLDEGALKFTPFPKPGTGPKGKRPAWTQEYAHFFYGKALVLEGKKSGNAKQFEEALLVLTDVPVPGQDKETTGGFLGRFKGGNSRWLPEAMLLKAEALVGLKKYDEASAAYNELFDQAVGAGLAPRWVYEAKIGPGRVAEAQGDSDKAVRAYEQAPTALETLLAQAPNRCLRLDIGRYYSLMRMQAAEVLLKKAEAAGTAAAFMPVRGYLEDSTADALKKRLGGRPPEQLEAFLAGARDAQVLAVLASGLGQAYLAEKRYDDALLALASVAVRSSSARDRAASALYHMAKAAEGAAQAAQGDAKKFYEDTKASALKRLKSEYADSPYATK
jgi:tetratricopeptide (TPR) repeat protein